MLNCYKLYATVWIVVIILYDLDWSGYCTPLNIWLRIFIYSSIAICYILGYFTKSKFRYSPVTKKFDIGNFGTFALCGIQLIEYAICGEIPIVSVVLTGANYADYEGIPTLHVLIYTFATFYSQYLFYAYLNEKKFKYIRNYLIIVFVVYGLQFMRGGLMICLAISFIMFVSKIQHKIKMKHVGTMVVGVLIALYIFGGLGNIRQGSSWDDTSAFLRFGKFNDNFPSWIPEQFAWFYLYVVGSLGTLNYNINSHTADPDVFLFVKSIIPDFIERRLWSDIVQESPDLIWKGFTTTTGYFDSYYYGGIIGMYVMFFILIFISAFVVYSSVLDEKYRVLTIANVSVIMALYFFTNAIHNSAIAFSIFYPILFSFLPFRFKIPKIKFKINGDANMK